MASPAPAGGLAFDWRNGLIMRGFLDGGQLRYDVVDIADQKTAPTSESAAKNAYTGNLLYH
jgi:hypothetical protein